jgi:hypothetical protein
MIGPTLCRPGGVHTDNIIRLDLDESLAKQKQEYENVKEKSQKELELFHQKHDKEFQALQKHADEDDQKVFWQLSPRFVKASSPNSLRWS